MSNAEGEPVVQAYAEWRPLTARRCRRQSGTVRGGRSGDRMMTVVDSEVADQHAGYGDIAEVRYLV